MHDILSAIRKKTKLVGIEVKMSILVDDMIKIGSYSKKVMSIYSKNYVIMNE